MRHIGDCYHQAEAFALRLAIDGVVEIARGFAVDSDQRQVTNVFASGMVLFEHFLGQFFGDFFHRLGKDIGQRMLAQRDFDFHAGVGVTAQHFHHASHRLGVFGGLLDDLDRDYLTGLSAAFIAGGDENVLGDTLVFRRHQHDAVLHQQAPDDMSVGAFQHFNDLAFAPPAPIQADFTRHDTVAVHGFLHFARR